MKRNMKLKYFAIVHCSQSQFEIAFDCEKVPFVSTNFSRNVDDRGHAYVIDNDICKYRRGGRG